MASIQHSQWLIGGPVEGVVGAMVVAGLMEEKEKRTRQMSILNYTSAQWYEGELFSFQHYRQR